MSTVDCLKKIRNKIVHKVIIFLGSAFIAFSPPVFADFGAGISYGSLGRSFNFSYELNSALGVRLNITSGTATVFSSGFYNNRSNGVLVDFYPVLTLAGVRLSGGFYDVEIDIANLKYAGFAPYLGVGLGRYSDDRLGLYFNADLGLIFSQPKLDENRRTRVDGIVKSVADTLGAYPVISFGMSLTF